MLDSHLFWFELPTANENYSAPSVLGTPSIFLKGDGLTLNIVFDFTDSGSMKRWAADAVALRARASERA